MDSRLRRFPPDRVSAVPYGQTVDNAMRCPPLAHRSAAAHKLHSAQANRYKIRESQNQNPGTGLSLFQPGGCPNDRDHRTVAGLASARARGRKGGRPFKMTPAKLRLAMAAMGQPETKVGDLCVELGIARQTLYRCISPQGELRPDGIRLLNQD